MNVYEIRDSTAFLMEVPAIEAISAWPATSRYFRLCVFLGNEQLPSKEDTCAFIKSALDAGAVEVIAAGSAGEYIHDCFDEQAVYAEVIENKPYVPEDECIMTSWLTNETITDVTTVRL